MIILGGHEHVNDHVVDNSRLMIIGSPLDQSKVEGGLSLPGVGFITLSRTADGNLQCKVTKLEKSVGDSNVVSWEAKSPRVFEVLPQNGHWTDLTKAKVSSDARHRSMWHRIVADTNIPGQVFSSVDE